MQLLYSRKARPRKTWAVLASAAVFFCLSRASLADPITLTSSALSSTVLAPSSDSISLTSGSTSFDTDTEDGPTVFQTGDFTLGDSGTLDQIVPFSFEDTLTLNGITEILDIFGQDDVTSTADTLSIFAGTPVLFGDENFTLQAFSATGTAIGEDLPIDLQASVSPTPEPSSLLLVVTGVLAVFLLAPATRRTLGSPDDTVVPPVHFIKMPVPARSWVQRGAAFHSAASEAGQPSTSTAPASGSGDVVRIASGVELPQGKLPHGRDRNV